VENWIWRRRRLNPKSDLELHFYFFFFFCHFLFSGKSFFLFDKQSIPFLPCIKKAARKYKCKMT
jgi:hypothetical protein